MSKETKRALIIDKKADAAEQLWWLNGIFIVFIGLGFLAILTYATLGQYGTAGWFVVGCRHAGAAILWALGSLAVGAFVGLLFGIPRMRQRPNFMEGQNQTTLSANYQPEINNNLIEVSDWLTKIIVGLGLAEFSKIPAELRNISNPLALCLGGDSGFALAIGVIVFFTAAGFLAGFINSRTFLAVMFRLSDDELLRNRDIEGMKSQVAAIEQAQEVQSTAIRDQPRDVAAPVGAQPAGENAGYQMSETKQESAEERVLRLATDFHNVAPMAPDRIQLRNFKMNQIAAEVVSGRIARQRIAELALARRDEALTAGLSAAITTAPLPGDLTLLVSIAPNLVSTHSQNIFLNAIAKLFSSETAGREDIPTVVGLLSIFKDSADAGVRRKLKQTMELISAKTGLSIGLT